MSLGILFLPTSLLLLVHLHILEYPYANSPEYDKDLFNPRSRGLRERAKTMEDIAYFLVGKIEGKGAKAILPLYPCNQPSESLAFRTSLTKYLEAIRHQSIFTSSGKSTWKMSLKASDSAIWWKDVVVRKSLIEECSGEKFERLMLSLSTHTLMITSRPIPTDDMIKSLHTRPFTYTKTLSQYQARRRAWTKPALTLMRLEADLKSLQSTLKDAAPSRYDAFSTDRLQAIAESKRQNLLESQWGGEAGKKAFVFLLELAGLQTRSSRKSFSISDLSAVAETVSKTAAVPSALPIAAAHHPGHLKKLRRPIFDIQSKSKIKDIQISGITSTPYRSHGQVVLAEQLDHEKRLRQSLSEALLRMRNTNWQFHAKRGQFRSVGTAETTLEVKFWTRHPTSYKHIDFDPVVGKDMVLSLGLNIEHEFYSDDDAKDKALDNRIEQIRNSILPSYPSVPDQLAPRKPPIEQESDRVVVGSNKPGSGKSKIPLAKAFAATRHHRQQQFTERLASSSASKTNPGTERAPIPPLMTPSKSSRSDRRKSVRFSMAKRRTERVSIFGLVNDGLDDEVTRLIDETNDFPTDDEGTDVDDTEFTVPSFKTPTSKVKIRPVANRIWTAGTPVSGKIASQNTPRPRVPSALTRMLDMDPPVSLPTLPSSSSSQLGAEPHYHHQPDEDEHEHESNNERRPADAEETPRPAKKPLPRRSLEGDVFDMGEIENENYNDDDDDVFNDDPPSMTLKDILLSADVSQFDLLDASTENIEEEMLIDDTSFVWE